MYLLFLEIYKRDLYSLGSLVRLSVLKPDNPPPHQEGFSYQPPMDVLSSSVPWEPSPVPSQEVNKILEYF
jgi:hypothetical protein